MPILLMRHQRPHSFVATAHDKPSPCMSSFNFTVYVSNLFIPYPSDGHPNQGQTEGSFQNSKGKIT